MVAMPVSPKSPRWKVASPKGPFTIEQLNGLTGNRKHFTKNPHESFEEAEASMKELASHVRSFVTFNVLDATGRVVSTTKGVH
jgi:hypothetical protein